MKEILSIENTILDFASKHARFNLSQIIDSLGFNNNSVSHYLTKLTKSHKIDRVGAGQYQIHAKQDFLYVPSEAVVEIYERLKKALPFTDFCIYDGTVFAPLQHHVAINNAIYVETIRDAIDTVFNRLKEQGLTVYKQPDAAFIFDYVNLQDTCIIVKPYITEAPVKKINNIVVPTLEKLLVDIQRDPDFEYMRGSESHYIFETAIDQFLINETKLLRYANRRGCKEEIQIIIKKTKNYDR